MSLQVRATEPRRDFLVFSVKRECYFANFVINRFTNARESENRRIGIPSRR